MSAKHTPGPWKAICLSGEWPGIEAENCSIVVYGDVTNQADDGGIRGNTEDEAIANARLIAAAPDQHAEMLRFLPVLERAEADPAIWEKLTQGLGIATANGFRAAIAKAKGGAQ